MQNEPKQLELGLDRPQQPLTKLAEVVRMRGVTTLEVPVERVLNSALAEELDEVLIIGRHFNSGLLFAAASGGEVDRVVGMAQRFIHKTYNGDYNSTGVRRV